jgi:CheY-like chemotaxis protein
MDKKKIVIADDEPNIRLLVKGILSRDYTILEARNGEEAIDITRAEKPDLMLLDIKMPVISGIELYRQLEAKDPSLAQRVIFITGDVMEVITREFLDRTGAPHIAKPFNIGQLKKSIDSMLTKAM